MHYVHCALKSGVTSKDFVHCALESPIVSRIFVHCALKDAVISKDFVRCALKSVLFSQILSGRFCDGSFLSNFPLSFCRALFFLAFWSGGFLLMGSDV